MIDAKTPIGELSVAQIYDYLASRATTEMFDGLEKTLHAAMTQGVPARGPDGSVVMIEGKPLMITPPAAIVKEARQFLKERAELRMKLGLTVGPATAGTVEDTLESIRKAQAKVALGKLPDVKDE